MNTVRKIITGILGILAVAACLTTIGIVGYALSGEQPWKKIEETGQMQEAQAVEVKTPDTKMADGASVETQGSLQDAHIHNYIESIDKKANCYQLGRMQYVCDICGDTYYLDIPMTGHKEDLDWVVTRKPVSDLVGLRVKYCIYCDQIVAMEDIPYSSGEDNNTDNANHTHSYVAMTEREPDCVLAGVRKYTCSCGDFYTEPIHALGHIAADWTVAEEATETRMGREQITCTVCGVVLDSRAVNVKQASPSPTTVAEGTNTPKPDDTPVPVKTPQPTVIPTVRPTSTPRSTSTPRPVNTPSPANTPKPVKTPKPTATATPATTPASSATPTPQDTELVVHFMNVGNADCTVIECDGEAMIVDAGYYNSSTDIIEYLNSHGISKLKYVVATHPHQDHIGGLVRVVREIDFDNIIMTERENDKIWEDDEIVREVNEKGITPIRPVVGNTYKLGSAAFTIIGPSAYHEDINNSSIAFVLRHGDKAFLFAADTAESSWAGYGETDIMNTGINIDVDVYRVNHHGSKYSTSTEFLEAMSPEYAVISCGDNNDGHPTAEVLNKLLMEQISMFRTDEGTVTVTSDGKELKWDRAPSTNWTPGEPRGTKQ